MELYNASDAPTIDHGVMLRLKRLDPLLRVTFSHVAIDPHLTTPVEVYPSPDWEPHQIDLLRKRGNDWYLFDPTYYLWSSTPDGRWVLVNHYPVHVGFGHREVKRLESDVARYMRPSDIVALIHKGQDGRNEHEEARFQQFRLDKLAANKRRIEGVVNDEDYGMRDAKIASYAGQINRGSRGQVQKDEREDGWESMTKDEYDKSY